MNLPAEYALRKAMPGTYEIRARASLGEWWDGSDWLGDDDDEDDERHYGGPEPRPVPRDVGLATSSLAFHPHPRWGLGSGKNDAKRSTANARRLT